MEEHRVNASDLRNILTIRPNWGNYLSTTNTAAIGTSETTILPEELITSDSVIGVLIQQEQTAAQTTQAVSSAVTTVSQQPTSGQHAFATAEATESTTSAPTTEQTEYTEHTTAPMVAESITAVE